MKACAAEEVVAAIRQILGGGVYLSSSLTKQVMQDLLGGPSDLPESPVDQLTDRELEIYQLVGEGLTTRQISDRLRLSVKTIETHKGRIKEKFQLKDGAELRQHAIRGHE